MLIIREKIANAELKSMAQKIFGSMVKAVVDIEQEIMAVDAELHADLEEHLLEDGAQQKNLWGINIYPDKISQDSWIEFDSMINIRPSVGNTNRGVNDSKIREQIIRIVQKLVTP